MRRRNFLQQASASFVFVSSSTVRAAKTPLSVELQKGDLDAPFERAVYDAQVIQDMAAPVRASFEKWDKQLPAKILAAAERFIGISRETSPEIIAEFLTLLGSQYENDDHKFNAFCAAGLSYCGLFAYASAVDPAFDANSRQTRLHRLRRLMPDLDNYFFYPTQSCRDMYHIAQGRHRWLARAQNPNAVPKSGWVVMFDWSRGGQPNHCGLVTEASSQHIATIEFNTSGPAGGSERDGGTVSRKHRSYDHVTGFVTDERIS
jgi:hypothetical protein